MIPQREIDSNGPDSQLIYQLPELSWHRVEANPLRIQASEGGVLYELAGVEDNPLVVLVTAANKDEVSDEQFATVSGAMNWIDEHRVKVHEAIAKKVREKKER